MDFTWRPGTYVWLTWWAVPGGVCLAPWKGDNWPHESSSRGVTAPQRHAFFIRIFFFFLHECSIKRRNERLNLKWNPMCWKLSKIPLHLNSSEQATCYPLSFRGMDEQVVFRRSRSIFSSWNSSDSGSDWLPGPHDHSGPRHPAGSCLGFSGGKSWERLCCWGNWFDRVKVRPPDGFFCHVLAGDVLQLPLK